ncbi:MAG: UPF0489 family protein [Candidatus Methanoperedens sp.]
MYGMRPRNIEYLDFDFNSKKWFFIIDHATALIAWKKAFNEEIIRRNTILFHLDEHTDFYFNKTNINKSKRILEMGDSELNDFVMKDLFIHNDEFIVNAMCSGLIKDGISFYFNDGYEYGELVEDTLFTPKKRRFVCDGIEHNFYLFKEKDISLIDNISSYRELEELFGCSRDFILDIDLDFFTHINETGLIDKTVSRTSEDISRQINSDLFKKMFEMSKVITVALEPANCGGNEQCEKILYSLMGDKFFEPKNLNLIDNVNKFLHDVNFEDIHFD